MALDTFLLELWESGRVSVSSTQSPSDEEIARAESALAEHEVAVRLNLSGAAPPYSRPAALWGAQLLYRACQLYVDRNTGEDHLREALPTDSPFEANPATHYCVDLALRYLPDVARLVRRANAEDPLLARLTDLGRQWPLSSVGMPDTTPTSLDSLADDHCLLAVYVDRIIATGDRARLVDPRVAAAVQCALGMLSQLAPALAADLTTPPGQTP